MRVLSLTIPLFFALATCAVAQTAQELLDKSMDALLAQPSFSGTASIRKVTLALIREQGRDLGDARYNIQQQQFEHIELRTRPPDDWAIKRDSQTVSPRALENISIQREISLKINGTAQLGTYPRIPGDIVFKEIPLSSFNNRLQSLLGGTYSYYSSSPNLVYRYLIPATRGLSNISWGLLNPVIKRTETAADGSTIFCVSAKPVDGGEVLLWIAATDFRITRCIQFSQNYMRANIMQRGYENTEFSFSEAVYTYDPDRKPTDTDFADFPSSRIDFSLPENLTRYIGVSDLIKLWADEIDQASNPTRKAAASEAAALRAANASTAAARSPGQALSSAQMNGIIIVEGDKGRASGFMTKIKNVDFVVTNLHVLGPNQTITLKTMSGATLPYTAIYGAVGRDIALLRITKAEGDLHLATDVMTATKIGQNVIVAGNSAGGGVANETLGNVKGLGPDRIEVDAAFQKGNSGSPIVSKETGEVIGVATYIQTSFINLADWSRYPKAQRPPGDTRWFGFRLDGPVQWQAIDFEKWQAQGARIQNLRTLSDNLMSVIQRRFQDIEKQPRLLALLQDYQNRIGRVANNNQAETNELKTLSKNLRSLAESDLRDIKVDEFYDYYRTCLYWDENVTAQITYRNALIDLFKRYEETPLSFGTLPSSL